MRLRIPFLHTRHREHPVVPALGREARLERIARDAAFVRVHATEHGAQVLLPHEAQHAVLLARDHELGAVPEEEEPAVGRVEAREVGALTLARQHAAQPARVPVLFAAPLAFPTALDRVVRGDGFVRVPGVVVDQRPAGRGRGDEGEEQGAEEHGDRIASPERRSARLVLPAKELSGLPQRIRAAVLRLAEGLESAEE